MSAAMPTEAAISKVMRRRDRRSTSNAVSLPTAGSTMGALNSGAVEEPSADGLPGLGTGLWFAALGSGGILGPALATGQFPLSTTAPPLGGELG
jgi:hypothetical protein